MIRSVFLLCALLLVPLARAVGQSPDELAGTWAFKIGGRNLVVLTLEQGTQGLQGTIQRPGVMSLTEGGGGVVIYDVRGAVSSVAIKEQPARPAGRVIAYENSDGRALSSLLRRDGVDRLLFSIDADNPGFATVTFVRADASAVVATDWDPNARYVARDPAPPPNSEIAAIFAADQADRQSLGTIDWSLVGPKDEARRARVREMLDEGLLRAADDYYYAAMVFQHGEVPEDYLLAHAMAMAAQALGRPDASWIGAATLDRFLQHTDRPQIFGTQYVGENGEPLTQGDYDSDLIPDSLRRALGVPTLEQQEAQRLELEKQRQAQ